MRRHASASTTTAAVAAAYDVLFFGSDHVALSTLQRLHANSALPHAHAHRCVNSVGVVCPAASTISAHALLHHQHQHQQHQQHQGQWLPSSTAAELPVRSFARAMNLEFLEKPTQQQLWPWPVSPVDESPTSA